MLRLNQLFDRQRSLATRLNIVITALIVVIVVGVTLLSIRREQQTFRTELERQSELLLATLIAAATNPLYAQDVDALSNLMERLGFEALGANYQVLAFGHIYDPNGRIIADAYDPSLAFNLETDPLGQQIVGSDKTILDWQSDQLVTGRAVIVGNRRLGAVSVGLSTAPLNAKLADVRNQGFLIALGAAIIGAGLVLLLSRSITRPIQALVQATQQIAKGNLEAQVSIVTKDEVGVLGRAFNQMTDKLRQMIETEQQAKNTLQQTVTEYVTFADKVSEGDLSGQLSLTGDDSDPLTRLGDNINSMVDSLRQRVQDEQESRQHLENMVAAYLTFVGQVAEGDLSSRLAVNGKDDALSHLGHKLNAMVDRQNEMLSEIQTVTNQIASASTEILASVSQQATGANEQSAAISQTTTTIEEVKAVVEQNAHKAQGVATQAQQTRTISQAGQQAITKTLTGMNHIKAKVNDIAHNILSLSERTQQITEITGSISEIAAQSNLLALNASVEAARAGESGKGFSVVAVEMRNLAEQSKQAAGQIKTILEEIQNATNTVVMATEAGTNQVESGVQLTEQTGAAIQKLAASIVESADAAQQIVVSTQQQTTGVEQVAIAMQGINQVTIQSLTATLQTEQSAEDLSTVAQQLTTLVDRYQLR